ncbi:MAG: flagellar protein FlaG [Pseudomonadaceae bacterium]|nr:flagellar protein FlaG [Pseudomonadaceae bacterium]
MNELSTQGIDSARAVLTDKQRKDAVLSSDGAQAPVAKAGQGDGKNLPSESPSLDSTKQTPAQDSAQEVDQAVAKLNDYVQSLQRDLQFSVDDSTGKQVVQVLDRSTDTVVRQIPNDVALRLARNLSEPQGSVNGYGEAADIRQLDLVNTRI